VLYTYCVVVPNRVIPQPNQSVLIPIPGIPHHTQSVLLPNNRIPHSTQSMTLLNHIITPPPAIDASTKSHPPRNQCFYPPTMKSHPHEISATTNSQNSPPHTHSILVLHSSNHSSNQYLCHSHYKLYQIISHGISFIPNRPTRLYHSLVTFPIVYLTFSCLVYIVYLVS